MDIHEMIALLRDPGENEIPGTIYDDLTTAHTDAVDGATAKVNMAEAANAELLAEVTRLKALNYDLLMAAGASDEPESVTDSTDDDNSVPSIDSLFEKG